MRVTKIPETLIFRGFYGLARERLEHSCDALKHAQIRHLNQKSDKIMTKTNRKDFDSTVQQMISSYPSLIHGTLV